MFDAIDDSKYPRTWKEMSFDYKLFFLFHGCMMLLMGITMFTGFRGPPVVGAILVLTLFGFSVQNRRKKEWRWPGASKMEIASAIAILVLGIIFLGAITPVARISNPRVFPWFAAGGAIVLLGALSNLHVVNLSKREFESNCGRRVAARADQKGAVDVRWKRIVRGVFLGCFLLVWLGGVAYFWKFNIALRDGSPLPTATQTEALSNHGKIVYITKEEERGLSLLKLSLSVMGPTVVVIGGFVHFILGVTLVPNAPTLSSLRKKAS